MVLSSLILFMTSTSPDRYRKSVSSIRSAFSRAADHYDEYALLQRAVLERLVESFEGLKILPSRILDLGCGTGTAADVLRRYYPRAELFQLDIADSMLKLARQSAPRFFSRTCYVHANAAYLPFHIDSMDIVFCNLMLQWCDDLDFVLSEIQRVIRPGGLFIFSSLGPDTLTELRQSWTLVDEDVHVNAFMDMHDIGDALVRNGLQNPVLSVESITMTYKDAMQLMREIKSIGAQNINNGRRKTLTGKKRLQQMLDHYEAFRVEGRLPATYEIIYAHAWSAEVAKLPASEQAISVESLKQNLQQRE